MGLEFCVAPDNVGARPRHHATAHRAGQAE